MSMMGIKWSEVDPLDCDTIELDHPEGWQKGEADKALLSERAKCLTNAMNEPFERKLIYTEKIIKRAMEKGVKWSISYSAGNDSTALSLLLTEHLGLKVDHVMSNTRMEDGETIKTFGERRRALKEKDVKIEFALPDKRPDEVWDGNVPLISKFESQMIHDYNNTKDAVTKKKTFDRMKPKTQRVALVAEEHGVSITHKCCDHLKKKPLKKWQKLNDIGGVLTGMRAEESRLRRLSYIQGGSLNYKKSEKRWMCNPIMVWRKEDVEQWLGTWGHTYRETRNGCTTCMYGAHLNPGENSLQKLKRTNPKMFRKAMDDWGYGKALRAFGIEESLDFYGYYHGNPTDESDGASDLESWFGLINGCGTD